jgi:hypothetical protein
MLKRIDWVHLASMAVFLGGLEYVLEEGPRTSGSRTSHIAAAWLSLVALRPVPRALVPLGRADREADAVPQSDLRLRLRVQPGDRLRALCGDLSDAGLPRPGARL